MEDVKPDLNKQSVEVEPGVFSSTLAPDGKLHEYAEEDVRTLYDCLCSGLKRSNGGKFLGVRSGRQHGYNLWVTYQQAYDRAQHLGSGFLAKGLAAGQESFVGIYAANCPQWVITNYAAQMYSMVTVPLYDTLGKDACAYIIDQTKMKVVVCDTNKKAETLLESIDQTPSLTLIVVMESVSADSLAKAEKCDTELVSFSDIEELGKANLQNVQPPQPSDMSLLCYTSGTTGNPKGVMLTHRNLIANYVAVFAVLQTPMTPSDVHISYLPLAHVFEAMMQIAVTIQGCQIGFFSGDPKLLMEDIGHLKPTIFPTVPRVLNRVYDLVRPIGDVNYLSPFTGARKQAEIIFAQSGTGQENSPAGAVVEAYGQTEATAGVAITVYGETKSGHVGAPLPCNLIKLVDVVDMEYFVAKGQGEVCVKGTNVMLGYYKDEEKTKEALDTDGWLHTGDIGQWLPNGTLQIIDRRKHIFKLALGEYVAPEKIEQIYVRSSLVAQVFVDGDSLQNYAVAIVVPDPDVLLGFAKKQGIKGLSFEELCQNQVVQKAVLENLQKEGTTAGLKSFEQVQKIHLHPEMFSVENGLLTPTFKSKRPALRKTFADKIKELYSVE